MKSVEELLNAKNIIPERPPSLDAKGRRLDIFPAKVQGRFRLLRNRVYSALLILFLVVPWTKYSGQQTILLDISNGKFVFFGVTLLAHDGPLVFLILGAVVFGLLYATAFYGRVWCGWACPQTVFIDGLFRRLEEWIEGDHRQRKKLSLSPMNRKKFFKKSVKWVIFLIISSHIAHSFVAYFIGAESLFWITLNPTFDTLTLFLFLQIFTGLIAVNFGWFKEQFCLVVCPYGRFQSVIMDANSKTVIYDYRRGEPRREKQTKEYGDCVNCFKCVSVCPTGIDIRNGQQLECIGCTACIDACDSIMDKLEKPRGLIRYASEAEIDGSHSNSRKNLRVWMYGLGMVLFALGLTLSIVFRPDLSIQLLRASETPYQILETSRGRIISNHFKLHLTNQTTDFILLKKIEIENPKIEVIAPLVPFKINSGEEGWVHIFLKTPIEEFLDSKVEETWHIQFETRGEKKMKKGTVLILGPRV